MEEFVEFYFDEGSVLIAVLDNTEERGGDEVEANGGIEGVD